MTMQPAKRSAGETGSPMESMDGGRTAEAAVTTWREVDAALSPIIGARGVAALYRRSIQLSSALHPWLAGAHDSESTDGDIAALRAQMRGQTAADAAAGNVALLQAFGDLLARLIGEALASRLLRPAVQGSFADGGRDIGERDADAA